MKIAITSQGQSSTANVDERFGRCQYIVIYDSESTEYSIIKNDSAGYDHGAGTGTASLLAEKGVEVVLTGGPMGPKAGDTLTAAGIKYVENLPGVVEEVVKAYLAK